MKRFLSTLAVLAASLFAFNACDGIIDIPDKDGQENTDVLVAEIKLDKPSLELEPGQSVQLTAIVSPDNATDKTVVWSSSDASVVSVDQTGVITGIGAGKATVKAKAGSAEATCSVEVTESDIEGLDDGGETNW